MILSATQIQRFAPAALAHLRGIEMAMERFHIDTPLRVQHWLAQCAFESDGFRRMEENLRYTRAERIVEIFRRHFDRDRDRQISPSELAFAQTLVCNAEGLANYVYANRMGNGDEASGDGWLHRGVGPIQLTGSDNQRACSMAIHGDLRAWTDPSMLTRDPDAMLSAGWFWHRNGCNAWADRDNLEAVSALINTGSIRGKAHGLDDGDRRDRDSRMDWLIHAKETLR